MLWLLPALYLRSSFQNLSYSTRGLSLFRWKRVQGPWPRAVTFELIAWVTGMSRGSHLVFNGLPAHFETWKQVLSSTTPRKLLWTPRIFLMTNFIYFVKITKKGLMNFLIRFSISLHTQAWDGVASHKVPPWWLQNTITKPLHSTSSTQKPQNHHIQYLPK